jgi:thiol:disulfide interchange protein DsbG
MRFLKELLLYNKYKNEGLRMNTKKAGLSILLTTLASSALATDNNHDPGRALLTKLSHGQVTILKSFPSVGNLEGIVIAPIGKPAQQSIVYVDKEGKYLIPNILVDADGNNVGEKDTDLYITSVQAPKIYAAVAKTNWVVEGDPKAPHKAYVLVEPNCSACHMLYGQIKPLIDSGQLQVRWIFVAFMRPHSAGMAAAIMEAKNPGKTFALDEKNFNMQTETGGVKPIAVSQDIQNKINQNMTFMQQAGFVGTPGIIFKTNDGKPQIVRGAPGGTALQNLIDSAANSF